MSIEVDTLIRKDEQFVPFAGEPDPTGGDRSKSYDGAILLTVDGRPVITTRQWDELDALWAYLLMGMVRAVQGLTFECSFPDQPLRLALTPDGGGRTTVEIGQPGDDGYKRAAAPTGALAAALAEGGARFLDWLESVSGQDEAGARECIAFLRGEVSEPPSTWTSPLDG